MKSRNTEISIYKTNNRFKHRALSKMAGKRENHASGAASKRKTLGKSTCAQLEPRKNKV
jgi:hypothetical protein